MTNLFTGLVSQTHDGGFTLTHNHKLRNETIMPELTIDLTQAQETIPEGPYTLSITDYKVKDSKSSPYQYIALTYTVQEGPEAGFKIRDNISMSPAAAFRAKQLLVALGIDIPDGTKQLPINPDDWMGMQFIGEIADENSDDYGLSSKVSKYWNSREYAENVGTEAHGSAGIHAEEEKAGRRRSR